MSEILAGNSLLKLAPGGRCREEIKEEVFSALAFLGKIRNENQSLTILKQENCKKELTNFTASIVYVHLKR